MASRRGRSGVGIFEKLIALIALFVTVFAMVFIMNMDHDTYKRVNSIVSRLNFNSLEEYIARKDSIDKNKPASTKVYKEPSPSSEEARREQVERLIETAKLEVKTTSKKEVKVINYGTRVLKSSAMKPSETKVLQKGQDGQRVIVSEYTYRGDTLEQTLVTKDAVSKKPVEEVVVKGVNSKNPIFMVPTKGPFSSYFGARWGKSHKGVDIAANVGQPVVASEGGEVTFSGDKGTFGKCVIVKHVGGYETLYAHNSALTVKAGEKVHKGQIIAKSGNTGRSTGPHLHFEIRSNGVSIDPMKLVER
ncbi:MAG: peptidoglycan DD-metalloendopeptidase family protein [Clostridium sp.]|uniref:M23 family metallopeptidase n=1 Tax=Clostridium sp. TaxID=1506 RepID=UPI002FCBAAA9